MYSRHLLFMIPSILATRINPVCDNALRMRELPSSIIIARVLNRFIGSDQGAPLKICVSLVDVLNDRDIGNSKVKIRKESLLEKISMYSKANNLSKYDVDDYQAAIKDLNSLQSNTQTIALAKYKKPEEILPLFQKQLKIAGITTESVDALNIIHVSGTKGKGSTCAFTESILRSAGLRTGFYNSPHLINVTERIRLDGKPIENSKFSRYFRYVYEKLVEGTRREGITMPSYFSFLTILAFHIFISEKVDCAIVEVGIGGEYDPTNIIEKPVACGITSIHFDHTNILGNSIESIAWSKAGIAKKGAPVFTIEQEQKAAIEVIRNRSLEKGCELYECLPLNDDSDLQLGIEGPAQRKNAALACQLAICFLKTAFRDKYDKLFKPLEKNNKLKTDLKELPKYFLDGLTNCFWDGRCQVARLGRITFFLDGAHTTESMENCLAWFSSANHFDDLQVVKILMVNVIGERSKEAVLRPLSKVDTFDKIIFSSNKIRSDDDKSDSDTMTKYQSDKSMENVLYNAQTWKSLVEERGKDNSNTIVMPNTSASIKYIASLSEQNCKRKYFVLVTGSLHFVGAVLDTLSVDNKDVK